MTGSKRIPFIVGGVVIVVIAITTGIVVAVRNHDSAKMTKTPKEYVLLEGAFESDEVDVSSKIPGRISQLPVEEGDAVQAGQILGTLESKEVASKVTQASGMYDAAQVQQSQARVGVELQTRTVTDQVKQAQAGLRAAQARLRMALNGARPQEVAQAQAAADQARAAYKTGADSYERFHGLYKEGVIPKQQEEEVELKYLSAKAAKDAADAKLSLVKEGARKEEIDQAREGVRAAEAQLKLAQDAVLQVGLRRQDVSAAGFKAMAAKGQLDEAKAYESETRIVAPISGYISERMSEPGEMVSAGFPILTIVKSRNFKVKVYADESKFGGLNLNQHVSIIVPALSGRTIQGKVLRVSQAADFATKKATNEQNSFDVRSLEIIVGVVGDCQDLRNGMTARVEMPCAVR